MVESVLEIFFRDMLVRTNAEAKYPFVGIQYIENIIHTCIGRSWGFGYLGVGRVRGMARWLLGDFRHALNDVYLD